MAELANIKILGQGISDYYAQREYKIRYNNYNGIIQGRGFRL
jgi:hypothetical protein